MTPRRRGSGPASVAQGRWRIAGVAAFIGLLGPASMSAQAGPPASEPDPIPAGLPAAPGDYDRGFDVLHYDIELGLGDTETWFAGRAGVRLRATRDGLDRAVLDFTGLAVDAVEVDGAPVEGWTLDEGLLTLPLGGPLAEGSERTVGVVYRGVPDDGLILGATLHGHPSAFVDNWPNRTRFWLPSVDHPSDKATARFTVHAPERWEVVANGRLVGQPFATAEGAPGPDDQPRRTWTWATEVPHPTYTLVVGGADMVIREVGLAACGLAPASSRPDGCVEVTTWLYPADAEAASPSFVRAAEMVDFFAELVGPFPYEKLAHVQSSTRFGGMENSSAIFYSEQAMSSGRDIEGIVSHETAHQWFGDSVTEALWAHLWLSEGFATYFGAVFFEYADGPEAFRQHMAGSAEAYLTSPDTLRPVVDPDRESLFDLLNRNSYQKGGWVLHMLRGILGDEAFFRGIRRYYDTFRDGTALTDDLRAVMEEVSGQDLEWFFRQWLFEPGYPRLALESSWSGGAQEVTLRQVQGDYAPRFRLPLELELRWEGGSRREEVVLDGVTGSWTFEVPAEARVVVDPDGWVLKRIVP